MLRPLKLRTFEDKKINWHIYLFDGLLCEKSKLIFYKDIGCRRFSAANMKRHEMFILNCSPINTVSLSTSVPINLNNVPEQKYLFSNKFFIIFDDCRSEQAN